MKANDLKQFCKEHRKEILIGTGVAVCAVLGIKYFKRVDNTTPSDVFMSSTIDASSVKEYVSEILEQDDGHEYFVLIERNNK